ncbi:hypothetical protein MMC26_001925 [Xylographa opegraphella]|nr:hypothetical protein [Xylographa opegraphella]
MDDICPSGNLILEIGFAEQKQMLRVSSHILCLASPVFKAMLNSRFIEGASKFPSGEKKVGLPDDSFDTVKTFCSIIHFQGLKAVRPRSLELIEDMSIFCDKYDATDAAMLWSSLHLESYLSKSPLWYTPFLFSSVERDMHQERCVRLFYVTYAFKNHAGFARVSQDILYTWDSTTRSQIEQYEQKHVPLPSGILGTHFFTA